MICLSFSTVHTYWIHWIRDRVKDAWRRTVQEYRLEYTVPALTDPVINMSELTYELKHGLLINFLNHIDPEKNRFY